MFKNFTGFHLLEALQKNKPDKNVLKRVVTLFIALAATFTIWLLPTSALGIPDLTIIQQRVLAIFVFATLMWVMEVLPAWTTSVIIITTLLLTISDNSFWFLKEDVVGGGAQAYGTIVKGKAIMATFADPIIMLFLGGFILAIAATKCGLDVLLAKVLLKLFGTKSENVLLGFLLVTGLFSMFISNTATAAMMISFLTPVLKALPADGKGRIGLALAIPVGANIGGIGTPIGTPPNAIALKYLNDPDGMNLNIGFGEWMSFMFPLAIVILVFSWFILKTLFPFKQKNIEIKISGEVKHNWQTNVVYITFIVTALLWMFDKLTGINANTVAMIPIAVFCATGIITRHDLEEINWSILWMVSGGFALGLALKETGLAETLVEAVPFGTWSPTLMVIGSGLLCFMMANFISHTATAALLVPILAMVGVSMQDTLSAVGGVQTLLIGVALGSSLAMLLPISTPPNALAHATGLIEQKDMLRVGIIMGAFGLIVGYGLLIMLGTFGYF